jgi:hemerythrin-like domain-containing protein
MSDHGIIADLSYRVMQAIGDGEPDKAASLCSRLAEIFTFHSIEEEAGLFMQLRRDGEATAEVEQLISDHQRLRPALSAPDAVSDPERLRRLLEDLARHAQVEDNDLFPFAMQQLPHAGWNALSTTTRLARAL